MILSGLGLVLLLLGILTLIFHRAGGGSIMVVGILVLVVASQRPPTDVLALYALIALAAGVVLARFRPGKILMLTGAVIGIAWALGVARPWVPTGPPVAGDPVEECRSVAFVGVRGSGEPPDAHGGYGAVVDGVRDRVAAALDAAGVSMADMPMAYPALGVTSDGWSLGKDLLTGSSFYLSGAATGADMVAARIELIDRICGDSTRVAVVGYSQGALASHLGLRRTDPAALADVRAVALVSDPARSEGQPGGAGDAAPGRGIVWSAPDRSALGPAAGGPVPVPQGWRSWCLVDDPVCAWRGAASGLASLAFDADVHSHGYLDESVLDAVAAAVLADLGLEVPAG